MPFPGGNKPVFIAALEGAQTGEGQYAFINNIPSRDNASRFGVWIIESPITPNLSKRNWSHIKRIIFGLEGFPSSLHELITTKRNDTKTSFVRSFIIFLIFPGAIKASL
jgi:hypothetical protein